MGRLPYVLAILFSVGAFVVGCGGDENGYGYEPLDVHAAETADERAAAELGERYAEAVDRGDLSRLRPRDRRGGRTLALRRAPAPGDRMQRPQGIPRQGRGRLHRRPTRHVRAPHRAPRRRLARHRGRRDEGLRLTREPAGALALSPATSRQPIADRSAACRDMQHLRGRISDSARRCPPCSAALATAETTPLRGCTGELTTSRERRALREAQRRGLAPRDGRLRSR
jgi:hypothetical protein